MYEYKKSIFTPISSITYIYEYMYFDLRWPIIMLRTRVGKYLS